ncbi:MAG: CRTAC1 family protein [Pseudomonadota bacterium]
MKWCVAMCGAGLPLWAAAAEPVFEPQPDALPMPHIYSGGWEHFVGGGLAVFDCNADGRPDLFAAGGADYAKLFINESDGDGIRFRDGEGPELSGVTGAYPIDIDSDGTLDLAILRVGSNALYRGLGECQFENASGDWRFDGGDGWSTAFSATWEGDAVWPTLAIGNYVDRYDPEGPFEACDDNELHRPESGRYIATLALSPGFCALSMLISDWQRSGAPELRISNDRHYYVAGGYEEMWRLDPLAPRGEAEGWDKISLWGMGVASADLTGDGRPEVMLTSMGDQVLQLNEGDGFRNAPFDLGTYATRPHTGDDTNPSTGWHAEFADVDNDGRLDLFISKGNVDEMGGAAVEDPNNLLMQAEDGTFIERAADAGVASLHRGRGAALVDFDGDGRLDLAVVNRRAPLEIWRNATDAGAWLTVEATQDGPNRRAVGAWIEVETPEAVQTREITVGGGHGGGQAGPIHFGLGEATEARVRVIWPDGEVGEWQTAASNGLVRLTR